MSCCGCGSTDAGGARHRCAWWRRKARALRQVSPRCSRTSHARASNAWLPSTATVRICRLRFLRSAFATLTDHDVVVGPTNDGGYYLVGAKAAHPSLFDGDGMGTQSALETLLARARKLQLSVGFTDPFYDIDVEGDLTQLAAELRIAPDRAPRTAIWLKDWGQTLAELRTGTGDVVKLTPSHRLYGLAAVMFVALVVCTRLPGGVGAPLYLIRWPLPASRTCSPCVRFSSRPKFPRRVVVIGLVLSALWHIPFLLMPPGPDDDVHRYLWDGRVQRLGYNPYILVPSDPAVSGLHTPETRTLNNPEVPSPYPAGAQLFFRAVTAIHESIFAFKVAFAACEACDRSAVARRAASPGARGAMGPRVCLEPSAGHMRGAERSR